MSRREQLLAAVEDGISDIFYYDRKNDEDLSSEDVEAALDSGEVSLKDLTDIFAKVILENFPNIRKE